MYDSISKPNSTPQPRDATDTNNALGCTTTQKCDRRAAMNATGTNNALGCTTTQECDRRAAMDEHIAFAQVLQIA